MPLVAFEASLYFLIAALPPLGEALLSDHPLTKRWITGTALLSAVAGAIAIKAFLNQTFAYSRSPQPTNQPTT